MDDWIRRSAKQGADMSERERLRTEKWLAEQKLFEAQEYGFRSRVFKALATALEELQKASGRELNLISGSGPMHVFSYTTGNRVEVDVDTHRREIRTATPKNVKGI